jgi:fatty acid desaturase 2 (delta-6 desaturase)
VFNAFHKQLDRVFKQSKLYHIGKVKSEYVSSSRETEIRNDFDELKKLATRMDLFTPSYFFFGLHGLHILLLHAMGYLILWNFSHSWLGILASLACLITAQGQASWTQHDYGHSSIFSRPSANRRMQGLFLGIIKGGSPEWWSHMHNQHHAKPNVIDKDPDTRTDPLFVLGDTQPIYVTHHESLIMGSIPEIQTKKTFFIRLNLGNPIKKFRLNLGNPKNKK